jgi:hypothetical protein
MFYLSVCSKTSHSKRAAIVGTIWDMICERDAYGARLDRAGGKSLNGKTRARKRDCPKRIEPDEESRINSEKTSIANLMEVYL